MNNLNNLTQSELNDLERILENELKIQEDKFKNENIKKPSPFLKKYFNITKFYLIEDE